MNRIVISIKESQIIRTQLTAKMTKNAESVDSYIALLTHSYGEMNKTMDNLEQLVDNMVLKMIHKKMLLDFFYKKK